ncbi:MAG: MCE family protein [Alphaproteobacteria bacterium]|nr:MCE family protein [Alphaproteobacteria bacterium]
MQQKKYKTVGLFIVIGMAAFIGIVLNYVAERFTTNQDDLVVMYFDESIRGLSVGSAVVFKGVEVGKVESISLQANLMEGTFKTPVLVLFNLEKSVDIIDSVDLDDKQMLDNLITKGLRAQLISANYLIGQLMIELVMEPKTPSVLRGTGQYWEIPTIYSPFAQISKDLEQIPLQESLARLGSILNDIEDNLPEILKNVRLLTKSLASDTPDTLENISKLVEELKKDMPSLLKNMNDIAAKLDNTMDKRSGSVVKTMKNFNNALEEFSKASRSIKNLTDYLERHPEAVIQGKEK